ncbi:hypothetical protein GCM10022420_040250 [Streptomyces iranensis]
MFAGEVDAVQHLGGGRPGPEGGGDEVVGHVELQGDGGMGGERAAGGAVAVGRRTLVSGTGSGSLLDGKRNRFRLQVVARGDPD